MKNENDIYWVDAGKNLAIRRRAIDSVEYDPDTKDWIVSISGNSRRMTNKEVKPILEQLGLKR